MTAQSTQTAPRSRRALLAGALGGLGVWAASAIGRAAPAEAAAGDPIRMGRLNKASSTATTLQTKTSAAAYLVNQIGAGAAVKGVATTGRAIVGEAGSNGTGVWAYSPNHYAVHAESPDGTVLFAQSTNGYALHALSDIGWAVVAESTSSFGMVTSGTVGIVASGTVAAQFYGPFHLDGPQDLLEQSAPAAPPVNAARLFARDNGSGKTELCVRFSTGAVQVIAAEA